MTLLISFKAIDKVETEWRMPNRERFEKVEIWASSDVTATTNPFERKNLERYAPSWPIILQTKARGIEFTILKVSHTLQEFHAHI